MSSRRIEDRGISVRRVAVSITFVLVIWLLAVVPAAFAYQETTGTPPITPGAPVTHGGGRSASCNSCHAGLVEGLCGVCHYAAGAPGHGQGPHGNYIQTGAAYTGSSARCELCHTIHDSPSTFRLLPRATVTATCFTCHDGTQGYGVYGAITQHQATVGGGHSIDTTNVVPGGAIDGGPATMAFGGVDGTLSCDDCHSPHNTNVVADFVGDRQRTTIKWQRTSRRHHVTMSSKLLKQRPGGASTPVAVYGSDWCLACHAGRSSATAVHNHPVDSVASTTGVPFNYGNVALLASADPTGLTVLGGMGGWNRPGNPWVDPVNYPENRGYLMPYPRTVGASGQQGHAPICQQCHEDSRDVGTLSSSGLADALPVTFTSEDGSVTVDNPRFQNFPHETENPLMVVETADDLCLNCHPTGVLP